MKVLFILQVFCMLNMGTIVSAHTAIHGHSLIRCNNKRGNLSGVLYSVKARSPLECSSKCTSTHGCLSATFRKACKECTMYSSTLGKKTECDQLTDDVDSIFVFVEPKCIHGGTWSIAEQRCTPCDHGFAGRFCERRIKDCAEGTQSGYTGEEIILIQPIGSPSPILVKCDFTWSFTIVEQRGTRYRCGPYEQFNRTWLEFKAGFGDVKCEFFIGLENLHLLTTQATTSMKVQPWTDIDYSYKQAYYRNMVVDSESNNFSLHYDYYIGNGGDGLGMGSPNATARNAPFCSPDRDCGSCAKNSDSGWWFNTACSEINLHIPLGGESKMVWPVSDTNSTKTERDALQIFLYR